MPSHNHGSNAVGGTVGLITSNGQNTASINLDVTTGEPNLYTSPQALTINNAGSGNSHNNMQPFLVIRYLIKY
jgi:microcystin-dependent protein